MKSKHIYVALAITLMVGCGAAKDMGRHGIANAFGWGAFIALVDDRMKARRTLRYAVLAEFSGIGQDAAIAIRRFSVAMQMLSSGDDLSEALWMRVRRGLQ